MASKAAQKPDVFGTPCPSCQQGTGYLYGVRTEGALKVLSYACQTCHYQWQASERWQDDWSSGTFTEPKMIRD